MSEKKINETRRSFLKASVLGGTGIGLAGTLGNTPLLSAEKASSTAEKMPYKIVPRRPLGKTGASVPILLIGGAKAFNSSYDKILHGCYKEGINYIDTGLEYSNGQSHRSIAPFIKQVGDRKKLWITSKVPHYENKATPAIYVQGVDECLKQLQTDYLDMFFMHNVWDTKYLGLEYLKMAESLKKAGKIRFFGFSSHGSKVVPMMNKAAESKGVDAIMFRYNFAKYGDIALNKAMDACKKAGIGLIAMKTQRSVPAHAEKVTTFKSKNFTLGQAKLKAVWADERIDALVSQMSNLKYMNENIAAAKSPIKLSMDEFQHLWQYASACSAYSCEGCSDICESTIPGDTRIADMLRFLMYHEAYNEPEKARELFQQLSAAQKNTQGIDFTRAAQACPQGIDIPGRLLYAKQVLG